ncbi:MAG: cyclase family protein [Eubacteriales bacterium]|nr:cyclase family protein [Eubacteriales bacterium]
MDRLETRWVDITLGLGDKIAAWPGDVPFALRQEQAIAQGGAANVTSVLMSSHFGTHMDAPLHYRAGGASIDEAPLALLMGDAYLLDVRRYGQAVGPEALVNLPGGAIRVLLRTCNERHAPGYRDGYAGLTRYGTQYLIERGVRLIGINAPSFAVGEQQDETHRLFLADDSRFILENAHLTGLDEGWYQLICLPIKLMDAEGAPARALVRKKGEWDER